MPHAASHRLAMLIHGAWLSQAIYAAAKLGLADLVHTRPQTAAELAKATGMLARPLYRLLRALASVGIFAESPVGTGDPTKTSQFQLTELADLLRSDSPTSQRAQAIMAGEETYQAYGQILHSLQTGQPSFAHIYGQPLFDYLSVTPAAGEIFDAAMTGVHGRESAAVVAAYDFTGSELIADIGGGNGSFLETILARHTGLSGILFDLPAVIERASIQLQTSDLSDRCMLVAGNFFEQVPEGADTYLLRHIIHDWDDAEAIAILRTCRAAMAPHAKLLVIESVIATGNEPSFGKLLDLTMLVMPGGAERTADEYRQLFYRAGLMLVRIVPTTAEVSVLEAIVDPSFERFTQELEATPDFPLPDEFAPPVNGESAG